MISFEQVIRKIIIKLLWLHPYTEPSVLFTSFEGQYNDNPKAISKKLHELEPSIKMYWAISGKCRESLPDYLIPVVYGTKEYEICTYRCQVLIDNIIGYRWKGLLKGRSYPRWLLSHKRQLNISTWHGTPIKKIGRHAGTLSKYNSFVSSCDCLISGCEYTKERLSDAFNGIPVKLTGTPRNDILVNGLSDNEKKRIKEFLGIPEKSKVVLYAPTFRDSIDESGLNQLYQIDYEVLFRTLKNRFGGDWVFVFRVHHSVLKNVDINKLKTKSENKIIDGNLHDDMADYLSVTDILITDYSGSVFDFALTDRPGFLFTPDIEKYASERGTYISIDSLPYKAAKTSNELYSLIREYDDVAAKERRDTFNLLFGNAETGHASETIANAIIDFLKTAKKENKLK